MTVRVGIVGCGFIAALHSRALKGIVDAGLVDAAVVATCDTDLDRAVAFARAHRAAIATTAGGGALVEHSIHDLDLLRFLLGEVADVSGRTANYAGHEGIEDVAVATLAFESGATAGLVSVWHGVLSRPSTRRLEVFCERGMAWTDDDYTGPLHVETSDGAEARACPAPAWVEELPVDRPWRSFAGQYAPANRSFLEALARGRPPEPGLDVALVAHGLADAVYRS